MKAYKTKEIFYLCTKCGNTLPVTNLWVWDDIARTEGEMRTNNPICTDGLPEGFTIPYDPDPANYREGYAVCCGTCEYPVAKWNKWNDAGSEQYATAIDTFPVNQCKTVRQFQCGNCNALYWDEEEASDCCL